MQISVQIVVQTEVDEQANITEIARFERDGFDAGSLGLHLEEAKVLLGRLQRLMIDAQAAEATARMSVCPECGSRLTVKGHHHRAPALARSPFMQNVSRSMRHRDRRLMAGPCLMMSR